MATWHQLRAATRLYHETEWTVVEDPPNDCRALQTFTTEQAARDHCARMKALRPTWSIYVLAPAVKP